MNVSEFIFDFFASKDINTAFIVTGGQAMFLNDAIYRNEKFKKIFVHHEQSATMSADAYGRIQNKPALALVTAGPGSVNAMNGVVGGYTDSSPMIIISGQAALSFVKYQEQTKIRQHGVQGINIKPLVENVVKYFVTIDNPQKILFYLEEAYYEATTGRKGPVWLDVPLDIQRTEVDLNTLQQFTPHTGQISEVQMLSLVNKSYDLLNGAKRPVLLVGQGISLADARDEMYEFASKTKMPVITSRLGIDLISSDDTLYVGRPGNYGERSANIAIQKSDLILSIGCRLSSSLVGHNPAEFGMNAKKIVIDIDSKELDKPGVNIDLKINMDCKKYLRYMLDNLNKYVFPDISRWKELCSRWKIKYPVVQPEYKTQTPINSYYFIDRLSELASSADCVMVDTGSCFHVACQSWKVKKGQKFLTTGGLSSMGYWCAGIGACLASEGNNTLVITGDGSLQMNIQEFATIKHNNLRIKTFILNNNGYLLIRHTQRNFMDNRLMGESPSTGLWCPDSIKIAEAYGIKAVRIDGVDEIDDKIKEVLEYDGPVVCDIVTQEWQLLVPRISSSKLPDGTLVSHCYDDMYPFLPKDEYESLMD